MQQDCCKSLAHSDFDLVMFIHFFAVSETGISQEEREITYNNKVGQIQEGNHKTYGNSLVNIMYDESS